MNDLKILVDQMEIGPLNNFIYFIGDAATKEVALVDPAWDVPYLVKRAKQKGYRVTHIFLTHGHPDHVNGLSAMLETYDVPVYLSRDESQIYTPSCRHLTRNENHARVKVGQIEFEFLHTPGHSPGCQCFYAENVLISGDTIFIDGCGRCDLPGGNARTMYKSLTEVIMKLPDTTVIYPGHNYGPVKHDTLLQQKQTNPYLTAHNIEEFLYQRMP